MRTWIGWLMLMVAPVSQGFDFDDLLKPEVAFPVSAERATAGHVRLSFDIADGYALYRAKLRVVGVEGFVVEQLSLPPGERVDDPDLGVMELYRGRVDVVVSGHTTATGPVSLQVTTQGCADAGVCFNPVTRIVTALEAGANG